MYRRTSIVLPVWSTALVTSRFIRIGMLQIGIRARSKHEIRNSSTKWKRYDLKNKTHAWYFRNNLILSVDMMHVGGVVDTIRFRRHQTLKLPKCLFLFDCCLMVN